MESSRRPPQQQELIINTLIKMRNNGLSENTILSVSRILERINLHADLSKPEEVKAYIARATKKNGEPLNNSTKTRYVCAYECLLKTYDIQWTKPKFRYEEHIPLIPTTENVNKIISASSKRYATIFTLLAEIGLSGHELHKVHRNDIDTEKGIFSVRGYKGHASGTYKLKKRTLEMLREYLANNPQDYPFPRPKIMGQVWLYYRNQLAHNLKQPELKNIKLKNLRNYSGAKLYDKLKDPIAVMRHLRHKKLETTMHYLRAITLNDEEEEYTVKTTTNVQEATELVESGFQYVTDMDNIKIFRKRK